MHELPDEKVQRAADFFHFMSENLKTAAQQHDLTYFEMDDMNFKDSLQSATKILLA